MNGTNNLDSQLRRRARNDTVPQRSPSDEPERLWPVEDLVDALGLLGMTKIGLLGHFAQAGKPQISLRELIDMCWSNSLKNGDYRSPLLLSVMWCSNRLLPS